MTGLFSPLPHSFMAIWFNYIFSHPHDFFFVQFNFCRVESKVFYGHKIVLVTASPRLQSLLSSKVNEGNGTPTVQINDIRYHIFEVSFRQPPHSNLITSPNTLEPWINNENWFHSGGNYLQLVMQYLYSGGCNNLEVSANDVLELMAAASFFQLEGLLRYTEARCAEIIDIDTVVPMYIHAKVKLN